jgi:PAS domain S-box-containing protein
MPNKAQKINQSALAQKQKTLKIGSILKNDEQNEPISPNETILDSISDGVFTVDHQWLTTSFNRAAEQITGVSRDEAIGRRCAEVFRSSMCGINCALQQTLKTGQPIIGKSAYIINSDGNRIPISVSTALMKDANGNTIGGVETFRDLSEIEALRRELDAKYRVGDLISHSPLMQRIFEVLPAIAASPSTVLLLGQTGTGKELIARTIHALSPRKDKPFLAVNCGALPDTLIESELFGYKAGAFTGATKHKLGRFALANGGTLFLDEIGEISPALQVRLLRVLQDKTFEPLGATASEKTDVRIIAATNRDLASQIHGGHFREDLYYRINVVRIEIPPLKNRKEDLPLLIDQFINQFNKLFDKAIEGISAEALSLLMAHDWPGNVRELENAIERSFILCTKGFIEISHLPEELTARRIASNPSSDIQHAHKLLDIQSIRATLIRNNYNRSLAAKELGIHKTTLFRKIKHLGITLPKQDGRSKTQ